MNITVFCGANSGNKPVYQETAIRLGHWIAENQHTLVYGGSKVGLMGILADTVLQNGGQVIGIIPTFLQVRELAHPALTKLIVVETMAERKEQMAALADAFVALPGGPGTLEEITEMVSWARIGQNPHPCIFFDVDNFYAPQEKMYDDMVENGFLTAEDRSKTFFSADLSAIESFIKTYQPPEIS